MRHTSSSRTQRASTVVTSSCSTTACQICRRWGAESCTFSCQTLAKLEVRECVLATCPPFSRYGTSETACFERRAIPDGKAQDENNKTQTNRTAGAQAATESSVFPALSLTADAVCFQTGQTVAAKHPCWVHKESEEFKETVPMRRLRTRPVKGLARAESTRTPTLTKIASST